MPNAATRRTVLGFIASLPFAATAQSSGLITIVVPAAPGGATDILARLVASKLQPIVGKNVIVENRPGANSIIGSEYVSRAPPNGSTLLLVDRMTLAVNPLLYKKLSYDPASLVGVSDVANVDLFFVVRSDAPYKTWAEMVAYARANPNKVSVGSAGIGSVHHLSLELLGRSIGAKFTHVPYKGVAPAMQDVMGGQLDGVISGPEVIQSQIAGGKIRVLATGADKRSRLVPEAPTLRELGFTEQVLLPTTFTLFAPAGTSRETIASLNAAIQKIMADPDVAARLAVTGLQPHASSSESIKPAIDQLAARLAVVIRDNGIHLD